MAANFLPTLVASASGASGNLIASAAGQSVRVWQILAANATVTATTVTVASTAAGKSNTVTLQVPANSSVVLPNSGCPWAIADTGTAVTFTGAANVTLTAFYTEGIGG